MRLDREIKIASGLSHPSILACFDSGQTPEGHLFYVMPYVEGESLRSRIERERQLAVEDAIRITSQIAGGLHYAHTRGIVHRDVKPENIYLTQRPMGRFGIKVLDFGITRFRTENTRLTKMGQALGSPLYMAPETCRGEAIDHRADI